VVPENIHTSPKDVFFFNFEPHHHFGNSSLASYFPSKILAFETLHPYPLGIHNDHPWAGYGYFLEPHN